MQEKSWFCSSLDIFAMLTLTCAVVALCGALWFTTIVPDSLTFQLFHGFLATAIISFLFSRLLEIIRVISITPDPKERRAAVNGPAVSDVNTVIASNSAQVVSEGKFSRAA